MRGDEAVRLLVRTRPTQDVFVSPAWVRAAWTHLPQLGSPLMLVVGTSSRSWWLPLAERHDSLRLAGSPLGDRHDLVGPLGADRERAAAAAVNALCEQRVTVRLHAIDRRGALAGVLGQLGRWTVECEPSPLIPTDAAVRSSGAMRRLDRLRRRGPTEILCHRRDDVDPNRVRAFAHARREAWQWRGRQSPEVEQLPGFEDFLVEAVVHLAGDDRARIWELRVDGALVAQDLHLGEPCRPLLYMRAFDPQWAPLSPGKVLLEQVLLILHEERIETLDSGRGDEPYKMALGGDRSVVVNAVFSPPARSSGAPW